MTGYEQDFIYKTIPRLTKAIEGLTEELKRLNDAKDKGQKEGSDNDDEKNEWEEFAIEFLKKAIRNWKIRRRGCL